jgi:hypothetical protein
MRSFRFMTGRFLAVALVASGCAAQSDQFDDRDWTKDNGIQSGAWREVETLFGDAATDRLKDDFTLRGVRHDVSLGGAAAPDTRCTCLDVAVGAADDPRFEWAEERPKVAPDQIVVAMRTEGSQCQNQPERRRPSIRGVELKGEDVIVTVEELALDRPQALGAVVRKPGPRGRLWFRPALKGKVHVPYARGAVAPFMCIIDTTAMHHQNTRRDIGSGDRSYDERPIQEQPQNDRQY